MMDRYPTQAELDAAERLFQKEGRGGMTRADQLNEMQRLRSQNGDLRARVARLEGALGEIAAMPDKHMKDATVMNVQECLVTAMRAMEARARGAVGEG